MDCQFVSGKYSRWSVNNKVTFYQFMYARVSSTLANLLVSIMHRMCGSLVCLSNDDSAIPINAKKKSTCYKTTLPPNSKSEGSSKQPTHFSHHLCQRPFKGYGIFIKEIIPSCGTLIRIE